MASPVNFEKFINEYLTSQLKKMKKKFTITAVFISMAFISFAQVCPSYFKRNNGNGTCTSGAEVQMYFLACPSPVPLLDSIYVNGVNTNVSLVNVDSSKCASKGYISYCISGDIPPAHTLQVFFNYGGTIAGGSTTVCNVPDAPEAGPMPVVLSKFDVQRQDNNTVAVTWKTDQEINSDRFELQRSSNNSPFETVATILSKNSNSSSAQYYSFNDPNTLAEASLYRIKMIDKDNSFSFSSVKSVKGTSEGLNFIVFPNPSTGNAKVSITNVSEPTKVMIFDNSGRVIKETGFIFNSSVDINNLPGGSYIIKVIGERTGASSAKKFTVINN
jgi:hypothetical protein